MITAVPNDALSGIQRIYQKQFHSWRLMQTSHLRTVKVSSRCFSCPGGVEDFTDSQDGLGCKGDHVVPTPVLWAGLLPRKSGCPEAHPTWLWTLSGMGHSQFLQAAVPCLTTSQWTFPQHLIWNSFLLGQNHLILLISTHVKSGFLSWFHCHNRKH